MATAHDIRDPESLAAEVYSALMGKSFPEVDADVARVDLKQFAHRTATLLAVLAATNFKPERHHLNCVLECLRASPDSTDE